MIVSKMHDFRKSFSINLHKTGINFHSNILLEIARAKVLKMCDVH